MVVGVMRITLHISGMTSLKEKRSIIKSILTKVKTRFHVAASETDRQDEWNYCEMGFSCVTNEGPHADSILGKIVRFIESDARVEIIDIDSETIHI